MSKNKKKIKVQNVLDMKEQIENPHVRLMEAMAGTKFMEVLDCQHAEDRVRLALRCHDPKAWSLLTTILLKTERLQKAWSLHICKQYTLVEPSNEEDDGLRFYWNLILKSEKLAESVERVAGAIQIGAATISSLPKAQPKVKKQNGEPQRVVSGEIMEYPLLAPPDRNKPEVSVLDMGSKGKRKGAHFLGGK